MLPYELIRLWQCCSCHIDRTLWQTGTRISRLRNLPCRCPPNGTQRLPRRCRPAQLAARPPTFVLPDQLFEPMGRLVLSAGAVICPLWRCDKASHERLELYCRVSICQMRENGPESAPEGHGRAPRADLQYSELLQTGRASPQGSRM